MPSIISKFLSLFTRLGVFLTGAGTVSLVIMLILIAAIWTLGPHLTLSGEAVLETVSSRLSATLILVFIWLAFVAALKAFGKKSAAKDPAAAEAKKKVLEDGRKAKEEKASIVRRVREAIKTVSSSTYYGAQKRSRYALPWYMVIGPENSGKTSALLNSGLKFPINEQADRALYQLKSTQSCDFLYSNNAVFIDTPGAYTQAGDNGSKNANWLTLLKQLRKQRPSRPLNGILVCVSMRDLLEANRDYLEHLGRVIRDRLSEVQQMLHTQVPVYLLLTKCDAVKGFAQFFSQMPRSEREQIFGASCVEGHTTPGAVRKEMTGLLKTLNGQVTNKVHQERDLNSRGAIFMFPLEMAQISSSLEDLISEAFGPSRYHQASMFRGFFFSSSLSAHDALASAAVGGEWSFQTGFQPSLGEYVKGFFLTNFFNEVMIPEAGLADNDGSHRLQTFWGKYGSKLLIAGSFVLAGFLLAISFDNNFENLSNMERIHNRYADAKREVVAANDIKYLLPTLELMESSTGVYSPDKDRFFKLGLGLYKGKTASKISRTAYKNELNDRFLTFLRQSAAREVNNAIGMDNIRDLKNSLRSYLMLYMPRHLEPAFLTNWQRQQWSRQYQGDAGAQSQLQHQLDSLLAYGIVEAEPDYALLERARQAMFKVPPAELAYQSLKEEAEAAAYPPFTFRKALGEKMSPFDGDTYPIAYLYTQRGFEQYMVQRCPAVIKELTSESWIFGVNDTGGRFALSDMDVNNIHKEVGVLYYRDYIRLWNEAFKSLSVRRPVSLGDAAKLADQLSGGATPAVLVLRELRGNINLITDLSPKEPPVSQEAKDTDDKKEKEQAPAPTEKEKAPQAEEVVLPQADAQAVKQYFATLDALLLEDGSAAQPLGNTNEAMAALSSFLEKIAGSDNQEEKAFNAVLAMHGDTDDTFKRLEMAYKKLPAEVGQWYKIVLDDALDKINLMAASNLDKIYKQEVLSSYNANLRDHYPFNAASGSDVNLDDFSDFFKPGGVLDSFNSTRLAPFVEQDGRLVSYMGRTLPISIKAVQHLKKGRMVHDAFFAGGDLAFNYTIAPSTMDDDLKSSTLSYNGKDISYWHGPIKSEQFHWPGGNSAKLTVEGLNGLISDRSTSGEWSIFRLFQGGGFKSRQGESGNGALMELRIKNNWVRYNVMCRNKFNPFDPGIYRYIPPASLR